MCAALLVHNFDSQIDTFNDDASSNVIYGVSNSVWSFSHFKSDLWGQQHRLVVLGNECWATTHSWGSSLWGKKTAFPTNKQSKRF